MDGDPLAHLRGSIRTGDVPGQDGVRGWGICFGDSDDVDTWVYFEDSLEYPGWVMTGMLLGDDASTADVITYLGPIQGEIALRHAQVMRERLASRGLAPDQLEQLDQDIAQGQAVLAVRIHDAQAAHTAEVARIATQITRLDPIIRDVPDVSPAAAMSYMTAVVHGDADEWFVFDDEDDENPLTLRCDPARGWVSRYATDPLDHWHSMAVSQACEAVGPLHAGDILDHTRAIHGSFPPPVAAQMERETAAARADAYIWMTQAMQVHAHEAHVLERMGRHFPEPGAPDIAP